MIMMGNPQRQMTRAPGSSWTLGWQLGSLPGMKRGTLPVGESPVACSVCGTGSWGMSWPFEPIAYGGMPSSVLMQWEGAWFSLNLICKALWTPHGKSYPVWGMDGRGEVGKWEKGGGRGNWGFRSRYILSLTFSPHIQIHLFIVPSLNNLFNTTYISPQMVVSKSLQVYPVVCHSGLIFPGFLIGQMMPFSQVAFHKLAPCLAYFYRCFLSPKV